MVEELHTRECLEYAAKTRRAFCIDQCAQARRAREAAPAIICRACGKKNGAHESGWLVIDGSERHEWDGKVYVCGACVAVVGERAARSLAHACWWCHNLLEGSCARCGRFVSAGTFKGPCTSVNIPVLDRRRCDAEGCPMHPPQASEPARAARDYKGEAAMDAALAISDEYDQARDLVAAQPGESLVDALKRFHDGVCAAPAAPLGIAGRLLDDLLESHVRVTGSSDYSYTDYDGDVEIVRRQWNDARAVASTLRAGLDWTAANGQANSSPLYLALVAEVTRSIEDIRVGSAVAPTARVIMSKLAHVHGLAPLPHAKPVVITLELHGCLPGLDHEAPEGGCRYGTNRCITHVERDDAARVTIHYFKPGSGKWNTDREIEWPRDPEHYTRWRSFEKVTRLPDLVAVCIDTPLGYPVLGYPVARPASTAMEAP